MDSFMGLNHDISHEYRGAFQFQNLAALFEVTDSQSLHPGAINRSTNDASRAAAGEKACPLRVIMLICRVIGGSMTGTACKLVRRGTDIFGSMAAPSPASAMAINVCACITSNFVSNVRF